MKVCFFISLFLIAMSCSTDNESENCVFVTDSTIIIYPDKATFFLKKYTENCEYEANVIFWAENLPIHSKAKAYKKNNSLYFKILKPESEYFKLFDFKFSEGEREKVDIQFKNGKNTHVDVILEEIHQHDKYESVYKFRILDGIYWDENINLDIIVFISPKVGFTGYYLQGQGKRSKGMYDSTGYILGDILDYSNLKAYDMID